MAAATTPGPGRRPRLLFYAMYDPSGMDSAPKVRIALMGAALERIADLERIQGGRIARARSGVRWLLGGGLGRVDAVYVESSTSTATPFDLALLLWARLRGRPVGIYFRDAYQYFRGLYPRTRRRHWIADMAWHISMPLMRALATIRFAPTRGLAQILRLPEAVLLPPGGDPATPDLGAGPDPVIAYVGATNVADGFDRLLAAMAIVHAQAPASRLVIVSPPLASCLALPAYVEHIRSSRVGLADALRPARVCVIPRPVNPYTDVAMPVKLLDYLAMGKPVVATAARETAQMLESSGAALVVADSPDAIAAALIRVIDEPGLAESMAARARIFSLGPDRTWDARAATVVGSLLGLAA